MHNLKPLRLIRENVIQLCYMSEISISYFCLTCHVSFLLNMTSVLKSFGFLLFTLLLLQVPPGPPWRKVLAIIQADR